MPGNCDLSRREVRYFMMADYERQEKYNILQYEEQVVVVIICAFDIVFLLSIN